MQLDPRGGGGDYQGRLGGFTGDRDGDGGGKQRGTTGGRPGGSTAEATKYVHPKNSQVMRPVWAVHGPMVRLDDVLTASNVRREELLVWRPASAESATKIKSGAPPTKEEQAGDEEVRKRQCQA